VEECLIRLFGVHIGQRILGEIALLLFLLADRVRRWHQRHAQTDHCNLGNNAIHNTSTIHDACGRLPFRRPIQTHSAAASCASCSSSRAFCSALPSANPALPATSSSAPASTTCPIVS